MNKQLAKGFARLMLVVALALVTAVVTANGQSRTRADVPFDFTVGDKTLAAGTYAIDAATAGGECVKFANTESNSAAVRLTNQLDGKAEHSKLVFHRYGQRYFLAEVWTAGGSQGRQLIKSRQERAIEKQNSKLASLSGPAGRSTYETVEIASIH